MSIKQGAVKISELQSVKGKFSLAGKKAIVTGGAGGFFVGGKALVDCLARFHTGLLQDLLVILAQFVPACFIDKHSG